MTLDVYSREIPGWDVWALTELQTVKQQAEERPTDGKRRPTDCKQTTNKQPTGGQQTVGITEKNKGTSVVEILISWILIIFTSQNFKRMMLCMRKISQFIYAHAECAQKIASAMYALNL